MKFTLLSLLLSFSAFAETTCFTRTTEIETSEVALARTLCFGDVEVQMNMVAGNKVALRYSLDENRAFKTAPLLYGQNRADGTVAFRVNLEETITGGFCGDTWSATSIATIVMQRDGTLAKIEGIAGEIGFSGDNCHSSERVVQELSYKKN